MLRVGIDRVAEQKQLHHRQGDDHPQRERVAPDLDPLLAQNREEAFEGKGSHDDLLNRWMNTSSSFGSTSRQAISWSTDRVARPRAARSIPAMRSTRPNT